MTGTKMEWWFEVPGWDTQGRRPTRSEALAALDDQLALYGKDVGAWSFGVSVVLLEDEGPKRERDPEDPAEVFALPAREAAEALLHAQSYDYGMALRQRDQLKERLREVEAKLEEARTEIQRLLMKDEKNHA